MSDPEPRDTDAARRSTAARYQEGADPADLFEQLYATGAGWTRTTPDPLLAEWAARRRLNGSGRSAIVVGSGLGADAEYVAALGFDTVAFDVSPTAIRLARERHPASAVRYLVADLLTPPAEWVRAFDLVVEIVTVQALPEPLRRRAIINVSDLVAPGGTLLVIAWRHVEGGPPPPPWPLQRAEIDAFATDGLRPVQVEELVASGSRFEPRWRAEFRRD